MSESNGTTTRRRRDATGNVFRSRGKLYARVSTSSKRHCLALPGMTEEEARVRSALLASFARLLDESGNGNLVERILEDAATATGGRLDEIRDTVERLSAGKLSQKASTPGTGATFGDVAKAWTSGELAKHHRDHVNEKRSAKLDASRLDRYVLPLIGKVPMRVFTDQHADQVMRALPSSLSPATRRHVAQVVHRVAALAVMPLRLIPVNPIPRGWMPKVRRADQKPQEMPFPDEVDRLLTCADVELVERLFAGFMAREGMRHEEGAGLDWADVDLDRGFIRLEENKTDDPRRWQMNAGCLRALKRWHEIQGRPARSAPIFVDTSGKRLRVTAEDLRAAYLAAKVDRPELHTGARTTSPSGFHGLRSLFVTEALAHDRTEKWVRLRTGQTSEMIQHYDKQAATFRDAGIPASGPLDVLLGLTPCELATELDPLGGTTSENPEGSLRVPARGFEPRFEDSKSSVLPLNDTGETAQL